MVGAIEWTKYIQKHFEHTLRSANIYGVVSVSCYLYHFDRDVWRAFCELWGPLTNTLRHGAGEVDISLYDLERIGGLPILGDVYEEFLPPNEDLMDAEKFPPTVLELLRIHAELCRFHKSNHVYWNWWLDHFYRGQLTWGAFGRESERRTSSNPPRISQRERLSTLNVTNIGELAAFLAFWLSRFVLPYRSEVIQPETFVMTSLMAKGQRISLAPTMLGYIYHGWLAEMFSTLYSQRPASECPADYPVLMRYVGMSAKWYTLSEARSIFRNGQSISFRASAFSEQSPKGRDLLNTIEICWLSSKVEEIFGPVEAVAKMEESVDVDRVKALSDQDLTCSSEIVRIEDGLNSLSNEAAKLKVKEQEILREEERIRKMREDLTAQQQNLKEAERTLKSSLDLRKQEAEQVKADLIKAGFFKLQDLEKENDRLKNLIDIVISFNNV
ncbi:hypothetical protein Cgig2_003209 [Carnegiea gigantea]|uniref:Aminotransferase-like plant mobile domain-containing protein n=1 Tax=Carnegiea gigantea TaxID=171969 RepID=A0A9Q1K3E8_9CARY|nr:hypothetical protein Cgig2_003209 [Carnegiea gigantea]